MSTFIDATVRIYFDKSYFLPGSSDAVKTYCYELKGRNTQKICRVHLARYFGVPKIVEGRWIEELELTEDTVP